MPKFAEIFPDIEIVQRSVAQFLAIFCAKVTMTQQLVAQLLALFCAKGATYPSLGQRPRNQYKQKYKG